MNSTKNLDINHNQNFISLSKLQRNTWTTETSTKKIDRKCMINRAYLAFFSMLISIIITLLFLVIHYKNQFHLAKTLNANLNSSTLTITNGLNQTTSKLCLTRECVQSSAYLLDRIDFNLHYLSMHDSNKSRIETLFISGNGYACGKFLKSKTTPEDHLSRNILQEIQDDIYIEMKNYLEKKIIDDEDDDLNNKFKLFNKKQLIDFINNSSHQTATNLMDELDQDKFTNSVQKRNLNNLNKKPTELNAVKKVKMFYKSCMNESVNDESTSVNIILNLIYEYGGEWPLLSRASYSNRTFKQQPSIQNPTYIFDTARKPIENKIETRIFSVFIHQIQPIFHFYVAPEEFKRNSKDYAIHLYSGSTILESSYFINNTMSNSTTQQANYRDAYIRLQLEILIRLATIKGRSVNITEATEQIQKVVEFETDLANITKHFSENSTTQNEDIITDMNANKNNLQNESNLNSNLNSNYSSDTISSSSILNQQRTSKTSYIRLNLTTLEAKFNFINWKFLFKQMELNSNREIKELLLESTDYLEQIELLFKRHSLTTIDNYLCWATIARFLPYLGSNFRRPFSEFRRKIPIEILSNDSQQTSLFYNLDLNNLFNRRSNDDIDYQLLNRYKRKNSASTTGRMFLSRWKECVHLTSEGLKKPIAILYLQEKKDYVEKIERKVNKMVDNIKDAFFMIVDKQNWLINDEIKEMVKKRADSIKSKIGFPQYLMDLEKADKQFEDLEIKLNDVFVANIIKMVRHEIKSELRLLNETIVLPIAILREPLISLKRPKYLDYSTLGVVIGHEIAHSFDTGTRKELNNLNANLLNKTSTNDASTSWWPKQLNLEYEKKSQCFVRQFNNYSLDEINENQAYLAYKSNIEEEDQVLLPGLTNLTPEQLFFVQYAQVWCEISNKEGYRKALLDSHAPGRFRANGVVSNSKQYAQAFNCKNNEPMNLPNKCDLWAY